MESPGWRARHEAEVDELVTYLYQHGATNGTGLYRTRWQIANDLYWSVSKVDRVIRYVRDHAEFGVGITLRWGGGVLMSSPTAPMIGATIIDANSVTYAWWISDLLRMLRKIGALFHHYHNHPNKQSPEGRMVRKRVKQYKALLTVIQSGLDGTKRPAEAWVDEYIDELLALV